MYSIEDNLTKQKFAVKYIIKQSLFEGNYEENETAIMEEINILKKLSKKPHSNIVKF